jgi:geranylgeranyl diphosphate synthase type I
LAGDTLFAEAFRILTQSKSNPERVVQAIHMLADVCVKICEGQHMDMSFEKMPIVKEKDYLEMIRKKTAVLYAASSSIGPLLNDCSTKVTEKMWKFGEYVGMGFQIYDDVLDLIGSKEKLGKDWGSDILQGKKTLVMIDALNRGVNIEIYGKKSATEEEIQNAVDILKECGSVDYSLKKARQLVDKGISQLDILEDSDAKRTLIELAEFLISREF